MINPASYAQKYISIRGVVDDRNSFPSKSLADTLVVYSKFTVEKYSQLNRKMRTEELVNFNDFFIRDEAGKNSVRVELENETRVMQANTIHESRGYIDFNWWSLIKTGLSIILSIVTRFSLEVEISERIMEEVICPDSKVGVTGKVSLCGADISIIPDYVYKGKEFLLSYLRGRVWNLAIWQTLSAGVLGLAMYFRHKREKQNEELDRINQRYEEIPRDIYADRYECIICFENPRDSIAEP